MKVLIATLAAAGMLTLLLTMFATGAYAALDDAKAHDKHDANHRLHA